MESSSGGGSGGVHKPTKMRAPPPPKKLTTCNPEDVKTSENNSPNLSGSAHRSGILKQSHEHGKEPQALMLKKLPDGIDHETSTAGMASQKADGNTKPLARSDEKMLKTFYGMFYTNKNSGKDWELQVDGFIPICLLQSMGNINKPFKIIAMQGSVRIMEFQVSATTKSTRTKVFVKWNDNREIMYGARFGKEDQAEQFHNTICRMVSTLSKTAQLLRQPERKMILRKMSDPENSSSSTLQRMKMSLIVKLPDKQTTVMSVPGLLTMSELFQLICKKESLDPACHQLSLPGVGNRKMTFDSETAVGSLKIREVSIIDVGITAINADTLNGNGEIVSLGDVEGDESKIFNIHLPGNSKKSFRAPLDMSMKVLVGRICNQENLNPRFHSLQYLDFKHEFLDMSSIVKDIDSSQLRLMDKRGRNIYSRKSLPEDTSLTLNHNHSDMSRHHMGNDTQRQSSVDALDSSSAFAVAEADVNPKRFSTPSLLDNLPAEFPGNEQNGSKVPNGNISDTQRIESGEAPVKSTPPPRPLPYASRSARPPRSQQDTSITSSEFQNKTLSPIARGMNMRMYASSPDLLNKDAASEASAKQIRTSTPEKRRRVAPPPPKPRRYAPSQTQTPSSHSVSSMGRGVPVGEVKPSTKKRPAPPRPSRPPPVVRRSSASEASEALEQVGKGKELRFNFTEANCDAARLDSRRNPPQFIAPPPPPDVPPPMDECATPVGPLTDEDLFYARSPSSRNGSSLNGFVGGEDSGSPLPSVYLERSTADEDSDVLLEIALKEVTRAAGNNVTLEDDVILESAAHAGGPPSPGADASVLPMVPPPVQFSESPESSRVGTPDIDGSVTPPLEPHEVEVPLSIAAIIMQEEAIVEIMPKKDELGVGFRSAEDTDCDSGYQDISDEITIVPPPPPPNHSDERMKRTEEPDTGSSLDHASAIPPPDGFATPPGEWEPEPAKPLKKLGIDDALFPWMKEPLPPMNAAIPVPVVEPAPGFRQEDVTEELPPPSEFDSVAQPEVTPGPSKTRVSEPLPSECAMLPEVTSKLHREVTSVIETGINAMSAPQIQLKTDVRSELDWRVKQEVLSDENYERTVPVALLPPEVIPELRVHTRDVKENTEMQIPKGKASDARSTLEKVAASTVKPEMKPKVVPKVPSKSWTKPAPVRDPYKAVTPDVVSQTESEAVSVKAKSTQASETDTLVKQDEQPEVEPDAVVCEVRPDVDSAQVLERLTELSGTTEPDAVEIEVQRGQTQAVQVTNELSRRDVICEAPVVAETSSSSLDSLNMLEHRFKDLEKVFGKSSEASADKPQDNSRISGMGKGARETDLVETQSSYEPFTRPLLHEESTSSATLRSPPSELPIPPSCSLPGETLNSFSLPPPLASRSDENQRAQAVEPAYSKLSAPLSPIPNSQRTMVNGNSMVVLSKDSNTTTESMPEGNSISRSHPAAGKVKRPLSVPPDLLNFDKVKVAVEQKAAKSRKEHSPTPSSSMSIEEARFPASVSPPSETRMEPLELRPKRPGPPVLRGYSNRASEVSFIASAAKKEEMKTPGEQTAPREVKPPRPPVPLKGRPHSWVASDVGKKPSPVPWSSAYKPGGSLFQTAEGRKKEFKSIPFSVKPELTLSAGPNTETLEGQKTEATKSLSGRGKELYMPKLKEKESVGTKPVIVCEKENELDVTKPSAVSGKEKELDVTKPAVVSRREKGMLESEPDVTSLNGKREWVKVKIEATPPTERETEGKRPGNSDSINTFSSPIEDEKPAATIISITNEGSATEAPKASFVNPSRGKYAVLFPKEDFTKTPETPGVGNTSHARQDGADKDSKQGLSSLSSRQKYNVLFTGNNTAAKHSESASPANLPNQPVSRKSKETPQVEKPHSSVVAGKTFEIIFAGNEASKLDSKSQSEIMKQTSERENANTEIKADARSEDTGAVAAGKIKMEPAVEPLKSVTKNECSRPVAEEKKVHPTVGTKPVGANLQRKDVAAQESIKRQPMHIAPKPPGLNSCKSLKLKMMAKDSSRDTDIVPRGLVATLKARAAKEESATDELNNNYNNNSA